MKYATLLIPFIALACTGAHAQPAPARPAGGFTGPGVAVTTVAEARSSRDDAHVRLRGRIQQHLGGDRYLFADASGSIPVDIDAELWQGQNVGAADTVEIDGEIDKDWNSVEVDVDRIRKL